MSLERANRLYRAGDLEGAEERYQLLAGAGMTDRIAYNLGTLRLESGDPAADSLLSIAAEGEGIEARQRANYNLGIARLRQVTPMLNADTALVILGESVTFGREALRLDPGNDDARWNLALAQRMLDSVARLQGNPNTRGLSGNDRTLLELVALTRGSDGEGESGAEPTEPEAGESSGTRLAASQGAREAWTTHDPGPLTRDEAMGLFRATSDDPEALVRGILWSQRPDVAWWNDEPLPGGNW
jgi:hypothetical protein